MRITSLARSIGSASAATERDQRGKSTYQFAAFCPPPEVEARQSAGVSPDRDQ
jgi:hypothetical protein